jgi:hypothetical protein
MTKPRLRLVAPSTKSNSYASPVQEWCTLRTREHLTIDEAERLIEGRYKADHR